MLRHFAICFFIAPLLVAAHKTDTYLSFEVGGSGIIASANFAKPIIVHNRYKLILQTGMGWSPKGAQSKYPFDIPVQLTCNFGRDQFFFEAGLGSTLIFKSKLGKAKGEIPNNEIYLSPIIGFRSESKNWFGRVFVCPMFHVTGEQLYNEVTSDFINIGVGIGAIF